MRLPEDAVAHAESSHVHIVQRRIGAAANDGVIEFSGVRNEPELHDYSPVYATGDRNGHVSKVRK